MSRRHARPARSVSRQRQAVETTALFLAVLTFCLLLGVSGIRDLPPSIAVLTFGAGALASVLLLVLALTDAR